MFNFLSNDGWYIILRSLLTTWQPLKKHTLPKIQWIRFSSCHVLLLCWKSLTVTDCKNQSDRHTKNQLYTQHANMYNISKFQYRRFISLGNSRKIDVTSESLNFREGMLFLKGCHVVNNDRRIMYHPSFDRKLNKL